MRESLNGLNLHVFLGGDDPLVTSSLAIRISRDAHERFTSEIGARKNYRKLNVSDMSDRMAATARIILVDEEQDLIILMLFLSCEDLRGGLNYYLIYDHKDASLSMIRYVPDCVQVIGKPVPKRNSGGGYELFLMARDSGDHRPAVTSNIGPPPRFLCVFSPVKVTATKPSCTWEMKTTNPACTWEMRRVRWNVPASVYERFMTDMTFSFQDKGFWADDSVVDFGCIELPGECQLDLDEALDCDESMTVTRTMGCVGGSIWFVCIHRGKRSADDSVAMWTLELPGRKWRNEARLPVRELWRFDGVKEAGLPEEREVGYPVLTKDGALCLVLFGQFFEYDVYTSSDAPSVDHHICSFDLRKKRGSYGILFHCHCFTETVVFPADFFQRKHGSRKRKSDELHPAAGAGRQIHPAAEARLVLPPGSN